MLRFRHADGQHLREFIEEVIPATDWSDLGIPLGVLFLVPGIGAQGGDLQQVSRHGINKKCGLLVNSSRAILYASGDHDFARAAEKEAAKVQQEMSQYLERYL